MKKIVLWKLLAAVIASLILFDAVMVFSIMAHAEEAVEVPEEVIRIADELGGEYNLCSETLQAIAWTESRFDPDAENDGCIGIMQISERWHQERMERLGVTDLKDIRGNMTVAADYLAEMAGEDEDLETVLMRYHGESGIEQRLSDGEMSEYVDTVLAISAMLERRNGK